MSEASLTPAQSARHDVPRVILLGASNLTWGLSTVIQVARELLSGPLQVFGAWGLGRSYGVRSSVLGRALPSIRGCGLWEELRASTSRESHALITDIGNDIAYEVPVALIVKWLNECIDQLSESGAHITLSGLPLESLQRLSKKGFWVFRSVLFPRRKFTLEYILENAELLQAQLERISVERRLTLIPQRLAWFGLDPIHIRRSCRDQAWKEILNGWGAQSTRISPLTKTPRFLPLRSASNQRWFFGIERRTEQPCVVLNDGTTISLY